jgi:hypothetical protein
MDETPMSSTTPSTVLDACAATISSRSPKPARHER